MILKIKENELSGFQPGGSLDLGHLGIITYKVFHYGHHMDEVIEREKLGEKFISIIRSIREASIALLKTFSLD